MNFRIFSLASHPLLTSFLIAGILVLLAVPSHAVETYTSVNLNDPTKFSDTGNNIYHDTANMDAVSFGGKEIIFYMMYSDSTAAGNLYYFTTDGSAHASVAMHSAYGGNIHFKAVVFNNVLYLFYTAFGDLNLSSNAIYYRTVSVGYDDNQNWKLVFSEAKTFATGLQNARLRVAAVMNGQLYVIYSDYYRGGPYGNFYDGSNWYYMSTANGKTFSPEKLFFTNYPDSSVIQWWGSGAVFSAPDGIGGWKENLMLAYCTSGPNIYYFFFDGESSVEAGSHVATGLSSVTSVRLFAGSAEAYTNDKYTIQVFITAPTSTYPWSYIYHSEYILSGPKGHSGSWQTSWTRLAASSSDQVYGSNGLNQPNEPAWTVLPIFTNESNATSGLNDLRVNLRIWYSRHSSWTNVIFGQDYETLKFRSSTYKSDVLEALPRLTPSIASDLSTSTVLGVIDGSPPFPLNGGIPGEGHVSTVTMTSSQDYSFTTKWSAGVGVAASYGGEFAGIGVKTQLAAGLKQSKETGKTYSVTTAMTLTSDRDTESQGGLGWVMVMKPEILNDRYTLRSYDRQLPAYDFITDPYQLSVITYGEGTTVQFYEYFLDDPTRHYKGETYADVFAGMAPRPLSTDVFSWGRLADTSYSDIFKISGELGLFNPLKLMRVSTTVSQDFAISAGTAQTEASEATASFSVSASALGFEVEDTVNYSVNISTTTAMTQSLGFHYGVPPCGTGCCIAGMETQPYLLIPKEDVTGYQAPWISDDIRNFQKPKPWCLTYTTTPSNTCGTTAARITIEKASGTLVIDRKEPERDRLSAKLVLGGIPAGFSLDQQLFLHLGFGSYIVDTEKNFVISRSIRGQHEVVTLREDEDSDSLLTVKLSYDRSKGQLDIDLKADRIDMSRFYAYPFLNVERPSSGVGTIPFGLFLGESYLADADLEVHCAPNEQNVICSFHGAKKAKE